MDISPRKPLKRPVDPVDDWLHKEGYFRKHAPRDPTCLFRAVSEQIYSTQHYHIRVRAECVDFMRKNSSLFEQSISIPFESYLEQISCFTEWGGINEIQAMSLLYSREFTIFYGHKSYVKTVTDNGFEETIYLCHTLQKQYESVYKRDIIPVAAFCQSLVYQTLYKEVFKMPGIDDTVKKMLHDRNNSFRHDKFFLKENMPIREQLTTELLSKVEKGYEENEEEKSIAKGVTPFPYRVAKALDPDIYRNTDFDIWHEIRREVRNAGWTRWNSTELQVGGKCLVQVNFKDSESEEANNNLVSVDGDKDRNGNTPRESPKSGRREPAFLYGHIQEMSKNEGPVVVFIEELGEKRTLPFAALKPLAARKTKQNNWNLASYRRNATYDSNQKWRRTWHSNTRRTKESVSNPVYATKNLIDRNNNNQFNSDGKSGDTKKIEQWDDESSDRKNNSTLKSYTMETYNACQGFPIENVVDVRPVTVMLDNIQLTPPMSQNNDDSTKNSSQAAKNPASNDVADRRSPSVGSVAPDSVGQSLQQASIHPPGEPFYPHHGMPPPIFPGNANMICASPEGSSYPVPFSCFAGEPPAPGSLLDRTIRAINFSVPSSVDANGSDLPFSDTVTLRFFFNLGLEYFRAGHGWGYAPSTQPIAVDPSYIPQNSLMSPNTPGDGVPQAATPSEDDGSRAVAAMRQNYGQTRRRGDNPSSNVKMNTGQQHHHQQAQQQQQQQPQYAKTYNNRKNDMQEFHGQRNNDASKVSGDSNRSSYANSRKNGPPSRYKKNVDGRNRNQAPPSLFQSDHHASPSYHANVGATMDHPSFQGSKNDSSQQVLSPMQQSPQQSSSPSNPPPFPPAYGPQPIYTAMPYYTGEGEAFFAPGPGFYPVPYVAHPDMAEASNASSYAAQIYPAGGENYGQPVQAIYPPYMYPQQVYSGLPPPIGQDNWYPVSGQPQFLQYSPMPPTQPAQNTNATPPP